MSTVSQHQADLASVPVEGGALAAATIRAVINANTNDYNAHDSDASIQILSGTAAARPAATAVPYAVYFATDTLVASYSNGTTWSAWGYTSSAAVPNLSDMMFLASTRR